MLLKGKIFSGMMRGEPYIKHFHYRLKGIIGFDPFPGTLNVKLEKPVDLSGYVTKTLEHVLRTIGEHVVEARLIPARIRNEDCWIIKIRGVKYKDDVLEIVAKENLRKKYNLHNGDEIEVEIVETKK